MKLILVIILLVRCFAFIWTPSWLPLLFGLSAPAGFFTSLIGISKSSQFIITNASEELNAIEFPNHPYHSFLYNQQVLYSALNLAIQFHNTPIESKALNIVSYYFCQKGKGNALSDYKFIYRHEGIIRYASEFKCEK